LLNWTFIQARRCPAPEFMPMSLLRFATAEALFETFPELSQKMTARASEQGPMVFLRALVTAGKIEDAVTFCAYLLPRREAVWWAIQCVRAMLGASAEDGALRAADGWVRTPEEDSRRAALAAFTAGDQKAPTTWLAFAAGWSGGSITPPESDPLPAPPSACAMGVNTAVMLAACAGDPLGVVDRLKACAEAGIRFAEGSDAKVRAPAPVQAKSGGKPPR
jgi:hypothetical protein